MTHKEFLDKIESMLPELNKTIIVGAHKIAASGCVDLAAYENNYKLPKMFLCAMGREISEQFRPILQDRKEKNTINNIEMFL